MNSPAREGLMRPFIALDIEVDQPVTGPFVGRLKAAVYRNGVVHHFRVVDGDSVMWLVPPGWLSPHSLRKAEMAMDQTDAEFLNIMNTVSPDLIWDAFAKVLGCPDGLDRPQRNAWLERRQAELVH